MTQSRKFHPFLPALSVAAALAAGAVQAQDAGLPRTVPLCSLDQELPLAPRVLNRIRARADFEDLLRYASANCAEVALLLADTATATVPGGNDGETGGGREDRDDRNPGNFPETEDPPAEDPPAEDPPAEDPPAEDPPAEDDPRTPQWTNPLR